MRCGDFLCRYLASVSPGGYSDGAGTGRVRGHLHEQGPLTDLAGRYTEDRRDNFDIYLPLWLARRNKTIFGTLFAIGELLVLGRWLISWR
jgi:hypothetical protein